MSFAASEKQFQTQAVELARYSGWLCYHTHDSRRSAPGFPDLVLVRPPRLIFAELKSEKGRVGPEQRVWLEAIAGCTQPPESYLWRPRDMEGVQKILLRGAKPLDQAEIGLSRPCWPHCQRPQPRRNGA